MNAGRFAEISARYATLRIAVAGDFCLDRYLEIDPEKGELSIETGLPVHNVVRVRAQPGGAGTILNNLAALGVGTLHAVGFCGEDGEGWELRRALSSMPGVRLEQFHSTGSRCTFTYCKPLIVEPGQPPRELNRLDSKNWTPTPASLVGALAASIRALTPELDAIILLDQVDQAETGVVTRAVIDAVDAARRPNPRLLALADSRRGLRGYPAFIFKMNEREFAAFTGLKETPDLETMRGLVGQLAHENGQPVFITMAERGVLGGNPSGETIHAPAFPVCGEIDIVGAGDAVTANLCAALAAGASLEEAMQLAMAAASIVVHQLGTTGAATAPQLASLLGGRLFSGADGGNS